MESDQDWSDMSPSAGSEDDEEYMYENCQSIYFHDEKLILDHELLRHLINSLKYFSIMTRKNVSETAHDEYIQHTNELLCQDNPLAPDDVTRRGEDIKLFGKCRFES